MFKRILLFIPVIVFLLVTGCHDQKESAIPQLPLTPEQEIQSNIDSLKKFSRVGDLILRLNDDIMSEMVRQMADSDKTFSHAGIIVEKDHQKMVCHIEPDDLSKGADTIRFEPIDSFINPHSNISCGWYRYDLSNVEKSRLANILDSFHAQNIHFDKKFDLSTNDSMYCSEMISKALKIATNNRYSFKQILVPHHLIKMMLFYFRKYHPTYHQIEKTSFIPIESLFKIPECKEVLRTKLKLLS